MSNKLSLSYPVIVEGKYDKIKLSSVISSQIIVLNGFAVFKEKEKVALIKKLSQKTKLIVLTDPDGAGLVIRNYIKNIVPHDRLINLYIPEIKGKERRKAEMSKEGLLGVEGIDNEALYKILEPFCIDGVIKEHTSVTRADLYDDGLLGGNDSSLLRKKLCIKCGLPQNISTSALVEALCLLYSHDEYKALVDSIKDEKESDE